MLVIGLLINILSSQAQNLCLSAKGTGGFVAPDKVCLGTTITVTGAPASLTNTVYNYDYKGSSDPNPYTSATSFKYAAPGSYTILQVAAITGGTSYACKVVEVLPTKSAAATINICSDRVVSLTYLLDAETIRYNFLNVNWGDGTAELIVVLNGTTTTGTVTHTYAATGNYVVRVTGSYTNGCTGNVNSLSARVQEVATVDPSILTLTSDAAKATISYQGPTGFNLELYQKGAAGIYAPTGLTGTSGGVFTVPALPTSVNCFQVVAKDACGVAGRRSTEVCSLVLTGQAADRKNVLNWQPYAGVGGTFNTYKIYRNNDPSSTFSATDRLLTSNTDLNEITCNKTYCYTLEATIKNANASTTVVRSMSTCLAGVDTGLADSPIATYVSVQSNGVNVQATLPAVAPPSPYTLVVTRSEGSGAVFSPLGTSDDRSFIDQTAQTNSQSYCYQTAIRNACGSLSKASPPACTILLSRTANGSITWTSASPFSNEAPQEYQVIFIDPKTGASDKKQLGNVTTYQPDPDSQVTQYQIAAVNKAGVESYSNPLEVEVGLRMFLPNAFRPGSDITDNQTFVAKGVMDFWNTFEMTIYNRWGDVIFNTTDKNSTGWNGDANATPAPAGYYGYRIRVTDMSGKAYNRTGQVLLIR